MRKRHAARVQRPRGQIPNAIRRDSEDTLAHRDEDTLAHASSVTPVPGTASRPEHCAEQKLSLAELCRRARRAPGLTNIHVTKSPGTLPPCRARRIRSVKTPRPSSMTPARRHIHTSKSPHGLLRRNPEIHSRVQIAAVHAHEHDPAEHSHCQILDVCFYAS